MRAMPRRCSHRRTVLSGDSHHALGALAGRGRRGGTKRPLEFPIRSRRKWWLMRTGILASTRCMMILLCQRGEGTMGNMHALVSRLLPWALALLLYLATFAAAVQLAL